MGFFSGLWDSLRQMFGGANAYSGANGSRLYVGNLSYKVKEDELRAVFAKYGKVRTLHLIRDRITRRLKGYAFIEMAPEDASRALSLNGVDFLGRKLVVSMAKSKKAAEPPRQPSPTKPQQPQGKDQGQGQYGQGPQRQGRRGRSGGGERWKKNRSGPRAYGADKGDNTPLQRYE